MIKHAMPEHNAQTLTASFNDSSSLSAMSNIEKVLLALSVLCSLTYLITTDFRPYPGRVIVKAASIAPFALIAFRALRNSDGMLLGISLLFSTLGDIFLGLRREDMFIYGLASFLVAHIFYVILFIKKFPRPLATTSGQKLLLLLLVVYSAAFIMWLVPGLGNFMLPVLAYVLVITAMCMTAILARFSSSWVVAGAVLFLISDSMIGAGRFREPAPLSNYLVWITYYLAQFFITIGFLISMRKGMNSEQ
jgi:uncharacterized membrane protein YhhN